MIKPNKLLLISTIVLGLSLVLVGDSPQKEVKEEYDPMRDPNVTGWEDIIEEEEEKVLVLKETNN